MKKALLFIALATLMTACGSGGKTDGSEGTDAEEECVEMTDEEATAQLTEVFARQAEQIQQSQLRLDIQKKYCAELSSVLTPQQLLQGVVELLRRLMADRALLRRCRTFMNVTANAANPLFDHVINPP